MFCCQWQLIRGCLAQLSFKDLFLQSVHPLWFPRNLQASQIAAFKLSVQRPLASNICTCICTACSVVYEDCQGRRKWMTDVQQQFLVKTLFDLRQVRRTQLRTFSFPHELSGSEVIEERNLSRYLTKLSAAKQNLSLNFRSLLVCHSSQIGNNFSSAFAKKCILALAI